jgi:NitT/TauT family transport system substrate-binding protein
MPMTRFTRPSLTGYLARYVAGALLLTAALLWPAGGGAQQKPLRPYTLILDFVPTGEYTPHYTALEKGYYREEGLDVKILRGQGSGDTVKRIAAGQGEVGIADISALIAARANTDVAVKAIALWYRRPPHGVFVRGDSPIKTSKELEGKKLAISPGNSHQILWPVFEKLSGLKPGSVTWVTMDAASMPPALIRSAVDAVPFFVVHEARIRKIAKQQNADIRVLAAWADLGFDVASTSLVAREETIAKDPEGLKAFLRATLKGADYAFRQKHFDEGVGYVVKSHPEVDPEGAVGAAQVGARFVYASEVTSGKMAVGQFDPAQLEKTRDLYTQYLELKRKVGLEEIYTNDLLPTKK